MGRRRALLWVLASSAACVGTNPRWDGTDDGDDEAAVGTSDDTAAGTTSADDGDDEASSSSGVAESSWTGSDESSSGSLPSGDDGPMCNAEQTVCNGECKNTSKDRKACGPECIDCTALYDKDATCMAGECRPDNSGPGGDD